MSAPDDRRASTTTTASASAATMRLRTGKVALLGRHARRMLGQQAARDRDLVEELRVPIGINHVDTTAENRERHAARLQRAPMRGRVDPERAARHDEVACARQRGRDARRARRARGAGRSRSDDRHAAFVRGRQSTAVPKTGRHLGEVAQSDGKMRIDSGDEAHGLGRHIGRFRDFSSQVVSAERLQHAEPLQIAPAGDAVKQPGQRACKIRELS